MSLMLTFKRGHHLKSYHTTRETIPYRAAQDFININEIPQDYLEQIAKLIIKNVGDVALGVQTDPFTGGGRYVPPAQDVFIMELLQELFTGMSAMAVSFQTILITYHLNWFVITHKSCLLHWISSPAW